MKYQICTYIHYLVSQYEVMAFLLLLIWLTLG